MYSPKLYDVKKVPYQRLKQSGFRLEEAGEPSYTVSQQDNMLFRQIRLITQEDGIRNPYIVFVDCKNAKNDPEGLHMLIQNGFHVGERHFKISESSASMTRNGILSFVDSTIYDELNRRVSMGCDIKYTVLSKWYCLPRSHAERVSFAAGVAAESDCCSGLYADAAAAKN